MLGSDGSMGSMLSVVLDPTLGLVLVAHAVIAAHISSDPSHKVLH